ncbi:MAG: YchJ family protein [Gammaproteobacteria bacterium]|nr:YchJ family protein [Gammaproteobacteria bacterium]
MQNCPCNSGLSYQACCEPFITGAKYAPTAEALMRARYSAYAVGNIDFVVSSYDKSTRREFDTDAAKQWSQQAQWQGLEIITTSEGLATDEQGQVEFKARYSVDGKDCVLHEISEFIKRDKQWFYLDGKLPDIKQYRRDAPKLGRNDPCSCGSNKKYKKCCGLAA